MVSNRDRIKMAKAAQKSGKDTAWSGGNSTRKIKGKDVCKVCHQKYAKMSEGRFRAHVVDGGLDDCPDTDY